MDNLGFGLQITVLGMGIVFGVLILLWLLLTARVEPALVAAITVALLHHAESRRLQAAPEMRTYWPGSLLFASRWVSAGRTRQAQSWRRRR